MRALLEKWVEKYHNDLLLVASIFIVTGILLSFVNIGGLLTNLMILVGTICLGFGFYFKGEENSKTKLSEYGTFMVGLAAIITLPQAPEMLTKVLEVRDISKKIDTEVCNMQSILGNIQAAVRTLEIAMTTNMVPPKQAAGYEPEITEKDQQKIEAKIRSFVHRHPGTPHLTQKKATEVIEKLRKEGFTRDNIESLLQEHLQVRHPQSSLQCEGGPK